MPIPSAPTQFLSRVVFVLLLLLLMLLMIHSEANQRVLPPLRVSFSFAPLIGGPPFLPIHIKTRVLASSGAQVTLDFVPNLTSGADLAASNLKLLRGGSVPGLLRCAFTSNDESDIENVALEKLASYIRGQSSSELSLLSNNCYHVAWRTLRAVLTENKKRAL